MFSLLANTSGPGQWLPAEPKLFSEQIGLRGVVIIVLFVAAFFAAVLFALGVYIRERRLEKLPAVLGRPKQLMDQAGAAIGLTIIDKYVLNKLAYRMRLPQPVTILLSPVLLTHAAQVWHSTHRLGPVQRWGENRLNNLARTIYEKTLHPSTEPG